jgi:hypothetical protein
MCSSMKTHKWEEGGELIDVMGMEKVELKR